MGVDRQIARTAGSGYRRMAAFRGWFPLPWMLRVVRLMADGWTLSDWPPREYRTPGHLSLYREGEDRYRPLCRCSVIMLMAWGLVDCGRDHCDRPDSRIPHRLTERGRELAAALAGDRRTNRLAGMKAVEHATA